MLETAIKRAPDPCRGCGALVPDTEGPTHRYLGASPGCWAVYGEILEKEYSDYRYWRAHRFTVDAYAVQHPGESSPPAIQSVAVHLISLYLMLEKTRRPKKPQRRCNGPRIINNASCGWSPRFSRRNHGPLRAGRKESFRTHQTDA